MKTLPYDVARCSGRFDLKADGEICAVRDTCQRYLALNEWDYPAGMDDYRAVPVMIAPGNCMHRIPVEKT